MKHHYLFAVLLITLLILQGCTATQETTEEKEEEEIYVFDQVPEENELKTPAYDPPAPPYYIVQIGAFTTKDKADAFASESKNSISNDIEVKFSSSVNLYVVQLRPYFKNRMEAESLRNKLWQTDGYQDAWILTVK